MAHRRRQSLDRLIFGDELVERLARQAESDCGALDNKRELLLECLRKLSDSQRQLLDDHYANRLSGREIAEEDRPKADAVFQSLHRTRETLLRCIEQGLTKRGDD